MRLKVTSILFLIFILFITKVNALDTLKLKENPIKNVVSEKPWYQNISVRGYSQIRYNRFLETNPNLKCEQCDRSWGDKGSFFMRRMRLIFFGQIHPKVYFYLQPDFASSASTSALHFGQIRDFYFDVAVDNKNEFRFRIGQSKVPFGFENLQSSQNRLALDRNDGLNSALSNERDLGVFFYWAPKRIRERFSMLVKDNYKGSGDYGVFGLGIYNGQTANKPEENNDRHIVARLTYPFVYKSQIFEPSIQAYSGKIVVGADGKAKKNKDRNYTDERVAASFIWYPRPFGITAEYNVGTGPEYNNITDSIENRTLKGGYVLLNYRIVYKNQFIFPFVRYQSYEGGKKHELDARSYRVKEIETGVEWQMNKNFELVVQYTISRRRFEDNALRNNVQSGNLLRIQAQVNF